MIEAGALILIAFAWLVREHQSHQERIEWREERQLLLDRIQAPEKAVYRDFQPPKKQHVTFDSDTDYWEAVKERDAA